MRGNTELAVSSSILRGIVMSSKVFFLQQIPGYSVEDMKVYAEPMKFKITIRYILSSLKY